MKKLFLLLLLVLFSLTLFAQAENIKVMTFNIRCGYCEDSSSVNNWSKRKYLVAMTFQKKFPWLR
ncbi:MAG: hypothetical protein ABI638_10915, partial [Ignavibacteriota bacterium]